jgi:excisionase family DNA binding protein
MEARDPVMQMAFTYGEAARAAGVSEALIRKLVATGKLRMVKINRCARIPRYALVRLCGGTTNEK